ncbi:YjgN family protein [Paracidovorax cattleyae]|uniref:Uncharacterized membrane protein YjgN, DUF898 family n=1 Tax=Paracidovorax cattleyae TaxID=80868 RepID=A0A1H0UHU0_9BURK|nr:YjgN family protein [Paracidovorax cattleyae]AVS73117.1 DUF898 domain-containing protein [Paracidovorax cattleyae]MBF9266938.1 DUF898 domain-containing protein [Paracidovorax cattleyae]SDP65650.1 Uncharacterized membrane protein YjgN, DUF898 family [Paracidovorax cattleyae]
MDQRVEPHVARMASSFTSHGIEPHPLEFTGSGGEYFRVWIVNVLLGILTLGLYTPWARRRTVQYFYGHTLVAGSPLEFTAQQRRMVFGFVVLLVLTAAYQIAVRTGQDTAVGLFILAGAALAPLIWGSAMRFRLGNTRWRGLRLQFTAGWRQVYAASWPVFAIAALWLAAFYGLQALAPEPVAGASGRRLPQVTGAMWGLLALTLVLTVLCAIRLEYNYRSILVLHSRLGTEPGRWKPVYMDFVKVWLATVGVFLLTVAGMSAIVGAAFGGSLALLSGKMQHMGIWLAMLFIVGIVFFGFLALLVSAPARAYREARLFQITWNQIGVSHVARFKCHLRARRFVGLRIRNLLLTLLTLGFYRPFARVNEYRMKLESVTLHVKGGVDQLAGQLQRQQQSGVGDALADAAGLDLIG